MPHLKIETGIHLYLFKEYVDMRKSFDSLAFLVSNHCSHNPLSGNVYIFMNKRRSMFKILFWDRTGYCLYYKRLESGKLTLPIHTSSDSQLIEISSDQLSLLVDGVAIWGYQQV